MISVDLEKNDVDLDEYYSGEVVRNTLKGENSYIYIFLVSHISKPGETISSHGFQQRMGGKGFNQAVAVSLAAGQDKVSFYGTVGDDESGRALKDKLWTRWGLRNDTLFLDPVDQRGYGALSIFIFIFVGESNREGYHSGC